MDKDALRPGTTAPIMRWAGHRHNSLGPTPKERQAMDPGRGVVAPGGPGTGDGQGSGHGQQLVARLVARRVRQEPMCVHPPAYWQQGSTPDELMDLGGR
jgi:hypothetical protein